MFSSVNNSAGLGSSASADRRSRRIAMELRRIKELCPEDGIAMDPEDGIAMGPEDGIAMDPEDGNGGATGENVGTSFHVNIREELGPGASAYLRLRVTLPENYPLEPPAFAFVSTGRGFGVT